MLLEHDDNRAKEYGLSALRHAVEGNYPSIVASLLLAGFSHVMDDEEAKTELCELANGAQGLIEVLNMLDGNQNIIDAARWWSSLEEQEKVSDKPCGFFNKNNPKGEKKTEEVLQWKHLPCGLL